MTYMTPLEHRMALKDLEDRARSNGRIRHAPSFGSLSAWFARRLGAALNEPDRPGLPPAIRDSARPPADHSTSYIRRKLSVGYVKAAKLVEKMQARGVTPRADHVGKREVLVPGR